MADIVIDIDYSDLSRTVDELKRLGKSVKETGNVIKDTDRAFEQAEKQILRWKESFVSSQGKVSASLETTYQKQKLSNLSAKESAQAWIEFDLAAKRASDRLQELRMKFQDGYAHQVRYRQSVNELKEAYRAGLIPTLEQYKIKLRELRQAENQIGNIRGSGGVGVAIQQVGYQVGDFAVQIQSGTNAFVAFGQQATQLVGVLPLVHTQLGLTAMQAIGLSTGLGIIIPIVTAFGAAWSRSKEQAKEATKALDPLEERLKSIDKVISDWNFNNQAKILKLDPDVYAGTQQLDKAISELADSQLKYNELLEISNSFIAQNSGAVLVGYFMQKSAQEELTKAQGDYLDSLLRVANLRIKIFNESRNEADQERKELQDRVVLAQTELRFGEDSIQYRKAQADIERRIYEERLLSNDILQEHVDELVSAYEATEKWEGMAKQVRSALSAIDGMKLKVTLTVDTIANNLPDFLKGVWSGAKEAAFRNFDQFPVGVPSRGMSAPPKAPALLDEPDKPKKEGDGSKKKEQEDYLLSLLKEADYKKSIIGLSEQEARRKEIIFQLTEKGLPIEDARIKKVLEAEEALKKATEAEDRRKSMLDRISSSMEEAFMSMVDGSKSVSDAFKGMLREILLDIYRQQVAKPISSGISDIIGGFLGGGSGDLFGGASWSANGNIVGKSGIQAFANGGVVGSATMFKHGGGLGVMGEAGPEAIMPLKRGKNGKLGVQMDGSSGAVNVTQVFNFSANGDESVKKIIAQAAPQIAMMTQKQIMDSRRRGGSMKATFG